MARYKETEKDQGVMIPIYLDEQLVSGTFEHMLNELIDNQMDLMIFDRKYNNDLTGAKAIEPRILFLGYIFQVFSFISVDTHTHSIDIIKYSQYLWNVVIENQLYKI